MPRRVLYVNTLTYIGGSEVSLLTLMNHLTPDRYAPHLLTSGEGPLLRRAQEAGIPAHTQEFPWFSRRRPWKYLLSIWLLVRAIRTLRIELVHTNCDFCLPYVLHATRLARVPYVCHVRDTVRAWFQPERLAVLNNAAAVIVSSRAMESACIAAGVRADSVLTIFNPVDLEAFGAIPAAAGRNLRQEVGIPADSLVVGIVGQVMPLKGHAEFVEVGLKLAQFLPDVRFLIVGSSPPASNQDDFMNELRGRTAESGFSNRFHFTGFRADVPAVMKAIDILVVPSWTEPFGRVAVEGMASGCAVIASDVDGLREIVTDGVSGLLVPPRNNRALFGAIHDLAAEPALRSRLSREGSRAAGRFAVAPRVAQIEALYDTLLAAGKDRLHSKGNVSC